VFTLLEQQGLPLDLVLDLLQQHNSIPDWIELYQTARLHGWNHRTIVSKLETALFDVYGGKFRDYIIEKLTPSDL